MLNLPLKGHNFYVASRHRVEFFGIRGILRSRKIYRGVSVKWDPRDLELFEGKIDAKAEVADLIEMDRKNGKEGLIHDILLHPDFAIILFFHSPLVYRMHLARERNGEIIIPGVMIGGKGYTIAISAKALDHMATRDINGKIIE